MKLIILTIAAMSLSSFASLKAQTKHDMDRIEQSYDECTKAFKAKTGEEFSWYCWNPYLKSLDSLETAADRRLIDVAAISKQDSLKLDERKWRKKRKEYFWKVDGGESDGNVYLSKKATYLKHRILYLIAKIKVLEQPHTLQ